MIFSSFIFSGISSDIKLAAYKTNSSFEHGWLSEILKICVNAGGSLSGEHGIGLEKKEQMPLLFSEKDLNAMKNLRDVFSPSNLFNPDKIFPNSVKGTPFLQNNAVKNAGKDSYI